MTACCVYSCETRPCWRTALNDNGSRGAQVYGWVAVLSKVKDKVAASAPWWRYQNYAADFASNWSKMKVCNNLESMQNLFLFFIFYFLFFIFTIE